MTPNRGKLELLIFTVLVLGSCVTYTPQAPVITGTPARTFTPPPQAEKKLVAIGGFENKSTYSADKLWETSAEFLMSALLKTDYFRLVEWDKIKQLVDYETLSNCSLFEKPGKKDEVKKILLCEYFIMGSVTRFDVAQRSTVSALSKRKEFETIIQVDLFLRDADTGEYLSHGTGKYSAIQTLSGGLAGGQTGTWDPASANEALDRAIAAALSELIYSFSRR